MLIEVLLPHRQLPGGALVTAMETCLRIGSLSTDLVAIEARKAMEGTDAEDAELLAGPGDTAADGATAATADAGAQVISLHARRLPPDPRQVLPARLRRMSPTITVTNQNDTPDTSSVPGRRMSLPGDPEDMLIDEACRELRLPAFRDRFIDLATSARREQATYKQFRLDMLQAELADRDLRRQ
ncbi:hypothetical protein ABTX82_32485 [Streptomyces lavendulae]